jgi:hypothetical protein
MELTELIAGLSLPSAYPDPVARVDVVQTHASVVFLAGEHAYKLKKPVDFGFLDYSTAAKREHMCDLEVELNRRLAPDVYRGVVPITLRDGAVRVGLPGLVIDHAVHMKRLPDTCQLGNLLAARKLTVDDIRRIGSYIAQFHRTAARSREIATYGRFAVVERNCLENFEQLRPMVGSVVDAAVEQRLRQTSLAELDRQRQRIENRARAQITCDTHGDLRLEHVYLLGETRQICIVDCIEFNERFRYSDPVSDIAFLIMDLKAHGYWDAATALADAYFRDLADLDGRELVAFYTAYRSTVRAKVRGLQLGLDRGPPATDPIAPRSPDESAAASQTLDRARGHILLALGELSPPTARPCVLLMCGLPGSGKSALARDLEGFMWLRADSIRKELAGLPATASSEASIRGGIYTPEWNDRTYDECLARVKQALFTGSRVVVDASFKEEGRRQTFVEAATLWGVAIRIVWCQAPPEVVRERLGERIDDPSDADWAIYLHAARTWEPFAERTRPLVIEIDTNDVHEAVVERTLDHLRTAGLA